MGITLYWGDGDIKWEMYGRYRGHPEAGALGRLVRMTMAARNT